MEADVAALGGFEGGAVVGAAPPPKDKIFRKNIRGNPDDPSMMSPLQRSGRPLSLNIQLATRHMM